MERGVRQAEQNESHLKKNGRIPNPVRIMPSPIRTQLNDVAPYSNAVMAGSFGLIKTFTLLPTE
jgi:hypothetical protein